MIDPDAAARAWVSTGLVCRDRQRAGTANSPGTASGCGDILFRTMTANLRS